MSGEKPRHLVDYLLETYQRSGLSRRRFLKRIGLSIAGAGALLAALAKTAKACGCGSCNGSCNASCNACNVGCNASCDYDICEETDDCYTDNDCNFNVCLKVNTCHRTNTCTSNRCEICDICTTNTCGGDTCAGAEDTCGTNSCDVNTCDVNTCQEDDWCTWANRCEHADVDCGTGDISCILENWCVQE
jgi:hypothetical protein